MSLITDHEHYNTIEITSHLPSEGWNETVEPWLGNRDIYMVRMVSRALDSDLPFRFEMRREAVHWLFQQSLGNSWEGKSVLQTLADVAWVTSGILRRVRLLSRAAWQTSIYGFIVSCQCSVRAFIGLVGARSSDLPIDWLPFSPWLTLGGYENIVPCSIRHILHH